MAANLDYLNLDFRLFLNDLDLEISYLDYGLYFILLYDVG